ncbi:MAG: hypothetical protein ACOYD9_05830 [Pyramidobacter sp.]
MRDQHGGDVDTIHNVRLIGTDAEMVYKNHANKAAGEIEKGNFQRSATKAPVGNSSQSEIRLNNKRTVQIWKEKGVWKYYSDGADVDPAELAAKLRAHAILFKNAGNGIVDVTRARVYKVTLDGSNPVIENYKVDSNGNLIQDSREVIKVDSLTPKNAEPVQRSHKGSSYRRIQQAPRNN